MLIVKNLKINGSRERPILLDVFYQANGKQKPLIIFCHGFKGFKEWGHFDLIAESFARAGFVCCKFNFSFNGGTEDQTIDFPDLEAFGQNNISTELNDLGLVIDEWKKENLFVPEQEIDRESISILGHSRGGGVCILKAYQDSRVKKLVTWAAVGEVGRLFKDEDFLNKWKSEGVIYIQNGRTLQQMPMYYQYYEDYINHKSRLDIPKAAENINIPWLIIHGTKDFAVPLSAGENLHTLNKGSELLVVQDGDHTFGGKHPWDQDELPEHSALVMNRTIEFLLQ